MTDGRVISFWKKNQTKTTTKKKTNQKDPLSSLIVAYSVEHYPFGREITLE